MTNIAFDWQIDEFMVYCRSRQLRERTMGSYEQTLRLFERWCKEQMNLDDVDKITESVVRRYINDLQERGKYSFYSNDKGKEKNFPDRRRDFRKPISVCTINNYIRNLRVFFNWLDIECVIKALRELPMASFPVLVIDGVPVVDVGLDEKKDQQKSAPLSQHIGEKKTDASAKSSSEESFIQNKESTQQVEAQVTSALTDDRVDEIKRYKDLLDCGILTKEEFDAKKKQLLGL